MPDKNSSQPVITEGFITMPYKYSVGDLASRFFIKLRDSKVISAAKCPACKSITVPPRSVCPKCSAQITELVDLSGSGTLETYTVVRYESSVQPVRPPYAVGVIKLQGAEGGLTHLIGGVDIRKLQKGMKLKPVFREKRSGTIMDIEYFTV